MRSEHVLQLLLCGVARDLKRGAAVAKAFDFGGRFYDVHPQEEGSPAQNIRVLRHVHSCLGIALDELECTLGQAHVAIHDKGEEPDDMESAKACDKPGCAGCHRTHDRPLKTYPSRTDTHSWSMHKSQDGFVPLWGREKHDEEEE